MFTIFLNEWLGLIIDVSLLIAISGLWLTWYRNGKRQQRLEELLMDTAQQLEDATMHLSLATSAIEKLQEREDLNQLSAQQSTPSGVRRGAQTSNQEPVQSAGIQASKSNQPVAHQQVSYHVALDQHVPAQSLPPQSLPPQPLPPQNSTQATMILRMQREGESEESIADRLDIPLAQVKLMLKLHAASNTL